MTLTPNNHDLLLKLEPHRLLAGIMAEATAAPVPGAIWYFARNTGDGLAYRFPAGTLAAARYLTADMLLDGLHLAVFQIRLQEGEDGPAFDLIYGALNQCSARIRLPLEAVNQNRWRYDREGAWLKPMCAGQRVDLAKVDRMTVTVLRKSEQPVRWCLTPFTATAAEPELLTDVVLPRGPLLDELGQSTLHQWPAKSRDADEVTARLRDQLAAAPQQTWPASFSRWGGSHDHRVAATGFFRTHHDGRRWWLVDPDGCLFWSAGMDCVRVDTAAGCAGLEPALTWTPDHDGPYNAIYRRAEDGVRAINYLAANFIRAFGPEAWREHWATIALAELRRLGFNTVANWSEWEIARAAGMPYVRPLQGWLRRTPHIYRDFPDVFDPVFLEDAASFADQLHATVDDPAFIGYFLMNEPNWGFATETPAAGMLFNAPSCASRRVLSDFLRERHGDDAGLAAAWDMPVTLAAVAEGDWHQPLTDGAQADLADFSAVMVERFFKELSDACRKVDPNHLNLGVRYYTVPPAWAVEGMRSFDVFSMNCYHRRVPAAQLSHISALLHQPIMIGEWHFGALDVGLPASGIGHVRSQEARGQAFRVYTEDAAAHPACVGVHYFTFYDQSALGRFDGENYNIGFLDVCNRPYEALASAARASHERIYPVAQGEVKPYNDEPEYLPKLFA